MYAVFRTGGKQYRAAKGDVLRVEKIDGEEGASVKFDDVLLIGEGSDIKVGSPLLSGGTVSGKVVRQGKSKKVPVVKFKRRQNYLRQGSHRQFFTEVEITGITGGTLPSCQSDPNICYCPAACQGNGTCNNTLCEVLDCAEINFCMNGCAPSDDGCYTDCYLEGTATGRSLFDDITGPDMESMQMQKTRCQLVPVIDDQCTAGKIHIRHRQGYDARRRGIHGRSDRGGHIDPEMRSPWLPVQHPLAAIHTRDWSFNRPDKTRQKVLAVIVAGARLAHIDKKRKALGIDKARERVLMDMADRREMDAA